MVCNLASNILGGHHSLYSITTAVAASIIGATVAVANGGMELYDLPVACSLVS